MISIINDLMGNSDLVLGDINFDLAIDILDVVQLVGEILNLTFGQSIDWLEENFPQLETKKRLQQLDKSKYFAKDIK